MAALKVIRKMIQRGVTTNIIKDKPAVARSIRLTDKYTRKVSDRDAKFAVRENFGKAPYGRQRAIIRNGTTGLSKREKEQVRTKQPVQKIKGTPKPAKPFISKKTLSVVPKRTFKKSSTESKTLTVANQELKRGTVTKVKPSERQIKMMRSDIKAKDIKNLVEQRTARQIKGPVRDEEGRVMNTSKVPQQTMNKRIKEGVERPANRPQLPYHSERESAELENSASKQWHDSKRTAKVTGDVGKATDVQNPMSEKAAVRQVEGLAARGERGLRKLDKRQDAADKAAGRVKVKVKVRQKQPDKKIAGTAIFKKKNSNIKGSGVFIRKDGKMEQIK